MGKINTYKEVATLWQNYKTGLKFYILKKVKDKETANDLSHEVLMKVYKSCCSEREIHNARSWLFQIAHNTTIDYFKKQQKFSNEVPEQAESEENTSFQDSASLVKPLIQLLPEKYATPLYMADIEEFKQSEVAQKLNLSLTAAKSRIQRARKLLKEKIIECSTLELDEKGHLISLEIKPNCDSLQELKTKNKD